MIDREPNAYLPPVIRAGRAWGFAVNLYGLRSRRNWGIGDFTDLKAIVRYARSAGAGIVGTNPLHALHYTDPEAASPYSPTTRYFRNPIYIDVEAVAEYAVDSARALALRERVASPAFAGMLATLRDEPLVAYARVARAKFSALAECYEILREARGARATEFRAFVERGGKRLETYAVYEALCEHFAGSADGARGWMTWPIDFRDREAEVVRTWARTHRRRVEYFKYLQWLADEQLAAVATEAREMEIGLYLDLAVGVDANSADVWSEPEAYVLDETVGAPPDPLGPLGQDWGLPPVDPQALLRNDGQAFAELLAGNMAHAGALRLDHVMALLRLFRIPRGRGPSEGSYHAYPFEELLALAARESRRSQCLIVGEDLGNVPEGFRERIERQAILSYRVLLYERGDDGRFRATSAYPALALATATTHDAPTLLGWAVGRDIDTRERIGLLAPPEAELAHRMRREDVERLLELFVEEGVMERDASRTLCAVLDARSERANDYRAFVRAAYAHLAATPARVVLVQLDDAIGEFDQVNVPGTFVEYPNWRRKSHCEIEEIVADASVAALADDVRRRVGGDREEAIR